MNSGNQDEVIVKNYQFLQDSGLLAHIETLQTQLKDMTSLVQEAGEVFNIQDPRLLTEYIAQKLLNKFVPSYLTFVLQDGIGTDRPEIITYVNMKPATTTISIPSLEPYKHFFSLSPLAVDFAVFEYMVGRPALTDVFLPLNPAKVIPIMGFDGVHGFIVVGKKILGEEYTELETRYLDGLINFASISFQNSLHYRRAITDLKTALYNHSFFMKRLEEEMARIRRYKAQITLLMFDVDHFKRFNDTYGHLAGDAVLCAVAKEIEASVRKEDVPARFGGEEFVVLLIQCNASFGHATAERIRKRIESLKVVHEGRELSVTISIGIAHTASNCLVPDSATLISNADSALYRSKSEGRNRTTLFQPAGKEGETDPEYSCEDSKI